MDRIYPIVGIDFGTCNSTCFTFTKGAWQCVKFSNQLFTPSCYSFHHGSECYGEAAKNLMDKYPESVIYDMKRYIGKHEYEFREMFDHFHYLFSLHENGKGQLYYSHPDQNGTNHRVFASAVVSKLYSYIIEKARKQLEQEVEYGVITVPAYFTDQQIEILKKAAQIAGLRQLDVIPEPTAAALAYQCGRPNSKLLIYDLGGGTFDVCILEVTIDGYKVIKCGGDPFLGGRDFDQRMLALIKKKLERNGVDVNALTNSQLAYLQSQAEAAKIALSVKGVIHATVSLNESFGGIEEVYIRKEEFENSIRDLLVHTCDLVEDYLDELDIELTDMDIIGLVGGSSQIPLVRTMLEERFHGVKICAEGNTTTIVAKGACMRAFQQYCRMHNIPIPIDYQEKKINQFLNQPIFLRIGINLERPVLKQGSPIGREQRVVYRHASDSKQVDVVVLKGIQEIGHFPLDVEKGKSVELVVWVNDKGVVNVRIGEGGEKRFCVNNWDDDEEEMNETFEDKVKPEVGPATEKEVELKSLEVAVEMWKGDSGVMWSSEESKKKAFEAIEKGVEEIKNNKKNEDAIHEYTLSLCGWHEKLVRSTMLKEHIREHIAELMRERRRMDEGDSQNKKTILEYIDKRISDLNSDVFNSVSLEHFDKNSTNFMSWLKEYSFCVCFISPILFIHVGFRSKVRPHSGSHLEAGRTVRTVF